MILRLSWQISPNNHKEVIKNNPCWVFTDKNNLYILSDYLKYSSICETENIIAYSIIKKPKKPK